jgi:glycine dehydrogenase
MSRQTQNEKSAAKKTGDVLAATDAFLWRHLGPRESDVADMLALLGYESLDALIDDTVPEGIRLRQPLMLREPVGEHELLDELR